jgi:hypothetical protein
MQAATNIGIQWGPALLVCFTVIIGVIYQNTRMNDMKDAFNKRFDDLKGDLASRIDGLRDLMKSKFRRVDERIERLESPLVRK